MKREQMIELQKQMKIEITINDIKQLFYCHRIVFFNHLMPVDKKQTYKMEHGRLIEDDIRELEKRRNLRKYNLTEGERIFHLWMSSDKMGLSGKLDMLIISREGYFPVDFKYTTGRPQKNHVYQLAGYALLIEEKYRKKVSHGFVYLIPKKEAYIFSLSKELKREVLTSLEVIRTMIQAERMPDAAVNRNKCKDCEFRNFCGDVS